MRHLFAAALLLSCTNAPRALHEAPPGVEKWADGIDWSQAGDETVEVLTRYLRVDTTNPPGNETAGAEFLKAELAKDGLDAVIYEFEPGRGSLIAKLPATQPSGEKPLCLLSHLDVVPAEADAWPADAQPLSGAVKDGFVWGRGALDMKGMGALELQTFRLLKRHNVPLKRDVILIGTADEEVGGNGIRFLTEQHWDELNCGHIINEGGLGLVGAIAPGVTTYAISVGEKGVLWLKVTASGEAGHGSTPTPERAPSRLAAAMTKLAAREAKVKVQPATYELLRRAGEKLGGFNGFVMQRPALVDSLAVKKLLEKPTTRATITDTCQVTGFEGKGSAPNVIPSTTSAILDCRLLPGTTADALKAELEALVKDVPGISFEVLNSFEAAVSEMDDEVFDALARHAVRGQSHAFAAPNIAPGYTDSVKARAKGARAYGFIPFEVTADEFKGFHGRDERVSVANVKRGVELLFRTVTDVAASAPAR